MKFMKKNKISFLLVVLVLLTFLTSCVSISPNEHETIPENIQTFPLVENGKFVYRESDFKKSNDENVILIIGKSGRQKFNLKDELFTSGVEKRVWNFSVNFANPTEEDFDVEVNFDVDVKKEDDKKYQIAPVSFENNYIEIPDRIDTFDVEIPYMIANIHDKDGIIYKVFVVERTKFGPKNPKHIIFDSKQEFLIFLENNLIADFSSAEYNIYSEEHADDLKKYSAVLNGIFKGVQRYEKGLYLF